MTMSKNWLIKLKNPFNQYQITVYDDGRVYSNEENQKICILTDVAITKIGDLIREDLGVLKLYGGYDVQSTTGFTVKFWDTSQRKRNLKIKGWRFAEDVIQIIFKESNFKRLFMSKDEIISVLGSFYGEEYSDE